MRLVPIVAAVAAGCLHWPATLGAQPSRKELLTRDGIIWGSAATWGAPYAENIGEDLKIAGLGRLWLEVKINFPNFAQVAELDWDRTYLDFIPQVRATTSTYEYYRTLQRFVALLKDGHTDVFLPKEVADREMSPAVRIDMIENRVFVTRVGNKSLEAAGVRPGLEIISVDSTPVLAYANRRRPFIGTNSPQHMDVRLYSYGLLSGPREKPVTVRFRENEGKEFDAILSRAQSVDSNPLPPFEIRTLDGNIAYVALNSFGSEETQKAFENALPTIRSMNGLIIDVRQNDGGSGVVAYNIIGHLVEKKFAPPQWKSRQYIPTLRAWGSSVGSWYVKEIQTWDASNDFNKPVVLLTGPRSLSATDVFAETFRRLNRGPIVGEATGGSTGDPLAFSLPGGGSARVSTSANVGTDLVGKGVLPTVDVPRTARDFLAGRDAALEAGLAELQRIIRK